MGAMRNNGALGVNRGNRNRGKHYTVVGSSLFDMGTKGGGKGKW